MILLSFRSLASLPILAFLMIVKGVPDNERDEHERQTDCEVNPQSAGVVSPVITLRIPMYNVGGHERLRCEMANVSR